MGFYVIFYLVLDFQLIVNDDEMGIYYVVCKLRILGGVERLSNKIIQFQEVIFELKISINLGFYLQEIMESIEYMVEGV